MVRVSNALHRQPLRGRGIGPAGGSCTEDEQEPHSIRGSQQTISDRSRIGEVLSRAVNNRPRARHNRSDSKALHGVDNHSRELSNEPGHESEVEKPAHHQPLRR